ncbi:hypothetical protein GQ457_05G019220 [Hibiscus cannabinus]
MSGCQSLHQEMRNGGIRLSTMSLQWLEPVFSVSHMPYRNLDGDLVWLSYYQIYAIPVFDMIETVLVKKLNFSPSKTLRFIVRNFYVAFTMFVAITFPFFGGLLGFFGGFAFAPTTYFLPCIMWLAIYKPGKFSLLWWTNWMCILFGVCLMVLSPIGGLREIILEAKQFDFYS